MAMHSYRCLLVLLASLLSPLALAQLAAPNAEGVSVGHVHFAAPDAEQALGFFESLGGQRGSSGRLSYVAFPGIMVLVRQAEAATPSTETVANHIGFTINDYAKYKALLTAAGADFFYDDPEGGQILADMPDGYRLEFALDREQSEPISFHHYHLTTAGELEALRSWYLAVLGAEAGERRGLPSAVVPGGRVDIMGARGAVPKPSSGGALDHIGFEVADMQAFAARMAQLDIPFDVAPRHIPEIGLTIAFITDPAGTYIEITEGFAK